MKAKTKKLFIVELSIVMLFAILAIGLQVFSLNIAHGAENTGTVRGQVWEDINKNGRNNLEDKGVANVMLDLYRDDGDNAFDIERDKLMGSTETREDGKYIFEKLPFGKYFVKVNVENYYVGQVLDNYKITLQDATDEKNDSDIVPSTHTSSIQEVVSTYFDRTVDIGVIKKGEFRAEILVDINTKEDVHGKVLGATTSNISGTSSSGGPKNMNTLYVFLIIVVSCGIAISAIKSHLHTKSKKLLSVLLTIAAISHGATTFAKIENRDFNDEGIPVKAEEILTYKIKYHNAANDVNLKNIVIESSIPNGTTFVPGSLGMDKHDIHPESNQSTGVTKTDEKDFDAAYFDPNNQKVVFDIGDLSPNIHGYVVYRVKVAPGLTLDQIDVRASLRSLNAPELNLIASNPIKK